MTARPLRTVFFGSSEFSVPALERLLEREEVMLVCSQPDRPAGRGLVVTPTPVTIAARRAGREVMTPERLDAVFIDAIAKLRPELLAVASYGKILPNGLLELPGMAALNVHPSLLPRYRGATPIQSALRDGCEKTGVTVFWMTRRMDAGDIALVRETQISDSDTFGTLHDRLARVGADILGEAAQLLREGHLTRTPQREEGATYCRPLTKEDLHLQLAAPAQGVVDQIRSLSPKPGAWMTFEGKRLKVLAAEVASLQQEGHSNDNALQAPGTCIALEPSGPLIATKPGAIRLLRVIPEGKPEMSGAELAQRTASRR